MTTLEIGWAKLTAATQSFLDRCDAVDSWLSDANDEVAVFTYDAEVEIFGVIPRGVHFDLDNAPDEVIALAEKL